MSRPSTPARRARAIAYRTALGICPTPHKIGYPSFEAADNAMSRTWRNPSSSHHLPIRAYKCQCKHWHLTSQPVENYLTTTAKATT